MIVDHLLCKSLHAAHRQMRQSGVRNLDFTLVDGIEHQEHLSVGELQSSSGAAFAARALSSRAGAGLTASLTGGAAERSAATYDVIGLSAVADSVATSSSFRGTRTSQVRAASTCRGATSSAAVVVRNVIIVVSARARRSESEDQG
jgi:hypothetical protein